REKIIQSAPMDTRGIYHGGPHGHNRTVSGICSGPPLSLDKGGLEAGQGTRIEPEGVQVSAVRGKQPYHCRDRVCRHVDLPPEGRLVLLLPAFDLLVRFLDSLSE